jgi:hypothetical protein
MIQERSENAEQGLRDTIEEDGITPEGALNRNHPVVAERLDLGLIDSELPTAQERMQQITGFWRSPEKL